MINGIHEHLHQSQLIKQTKEKTEILRILLKTKPAARDITHKQKRGTTPHRKQPLSTLKHNLP